jgi:ABC-2 type transport system permease protein
MYRARRLLALVKKEALQIVRDPSSIVIAFVLPLVLLFLFGYGISLDAKDIRIGIALEDEGWEARDLAMAFWGSPHFKPDITLVRQELFPRVVADELKGVLVIPNGFSAALRSSSPERVAVVQLAVDGSFPNTGSMVLNYSLGVIGQWAHSLRVPIPRNRAPFLVQQRNGKPPHHPAGHSGNHHGSDRHDADLLGDRARMGARHDGNPYVNAGRRG